MTAAALDGPLARLAPISLAELTEHAGLQTRVDRKYVLPASALDALLADLPADTRVLQIGADRCFGYESVYFDTRDLTSYRLAAHRRRRRFKVRTRTYLESGTCWLEVKTRGARGTTVKQRQPHEPSARAHVGGGRQFVADALAGAGVGDADVLDLVPTLVTRYRRSTLFLPDPTSRVTIDTGLSWAVEPGWAAVPGTSADPGWSGPVVDPYGLELAGAVVIETKTGSSASAVDRILWAHGHRPARISKYATGLAALHGDLPATPWHRTLRRHVPSAAMRTTPATGPTGPVDPTLRES